MAFTDVSTVAATGPVVIVNISTSGSHALLLASATAGHATPAVRVLELPDAPMDTVVENARTLLGAQERAVDPTTDPATSRRDLQAVFDVLAWAWRAITEPVLRALGCTDAAGGPAETWPRLWWCPTGPAAVLPLHAAGVHVRTRVEHVAAGERALADTVTGRAVSSYTPTLSALMRARSRPAPARIRLLAVGMPDAPAYAPAAAALPAVSTELRAVADHLPEPVHATHLSGPEATCVAVQQALTGHSWLHLSCHAVQDQADPNRSAFLLHDCPLTLADLTALSLPEANVAYLAACHTAAGSLELIDESLHLAAGLQLVGYRHVIATLWSISDWKAPAMAKAFYSQLAHHDPTSGPDSEHAPYAVHHAITRLQRVAPENPLLWAAYIHLGP